MKSSFLIAAMAVMAFVLAAPQAEARGENGLYRNLIARHCIAVDRDISRRYYQQPGYIHAQTVHIRSVRHLSPRWVRVYGVANSFGRAAFGHMDYNLRTHQVRCPTGNWKYNHLPLWEIFKRRF